MVSAISFAPSDLPEVCRPGAYTGNADWNSLRARPKRQAPMHRAKVACPIPFERSDDLGMMTLS